MFWVTLLSFWDFLLSLERRFYESASNLVRFCATKETKNYFKQKNSLCWTFVCFWIFSKALYLPCKTSETPKMMLKCDFSRLYTCFRNFLFMVRMYNHQSMCGKSFIRYNANWKIAWNPLTNTNGKKNETKKWDRSP